MKDRLRLTAYHLIMIAVNLFYTFGVEQAKQIAGEVLKGQSLEVDAVSGATLTSFTVLKAIENALQK